MTIEVSTTDAQGTQINTRQVTIGLATLSWKASATIEHTLKTYTAEPDFLAFFDQATAYFQEISAQDKAVADQAGMAYAGNDRNTGIIGGFEAALRAVDCDYVVMLENDCPLIESAESAKRQLTSAVQDMVALNIPVCRFRHRIHFGEGFCDGIKFRQYHTPIDERASAHEHLVRLVRRGLRPMKASQMQGRAVYFESHPEQQFPKAWRRSPSGHFVSDSWYLNWTNQSILVNRRWCLDVLLPWVKAHPSPRQVNGFADIEKELNCLWWRRQHIPIMVAEPGLFTHQRLDR